MEVRKKSVFISVSLERFNYVILSYKYWLYYMLVMFDNFMGAIRAFVVMIMLMIVVLIIIVIKHYYYYYWAIFLPLDSIIIKR